MRSLVALLALALCFSVPAFAQPACTAAIPVGAPVPSDQSRLQWNKATYSDASAITGESYVVASRAGTTGAFTDRCVTSALAVQMLAQPTGRNEYVVRTRLAGFVDSGNAGPVFKVNAPVRTLNPPTGLAVSPDNLVAFVIVKSRDRVALVPVGTVAQGTQCDASQEVLGRFVVPRASVTFAASVVDEVLFAECV